jgi:hypothetical protein
MASLFYAASTLEGGTVLGVSVSKKDVEALEMGVLVKVKLSPQAQIALETKATSIVILPAEDAGVGSMAKHIPGLNILPVNEGKPH